MLNFKMFSNILRPLSCSLKSSFKNNSNLIHSTVNTAEVDHFSADTEAWWDLNGKWKLLHVLNHVRVPFVRDGLLQNSPARDIALPLKDKVILDVGCGGGILSEALAQIGANVTGIDANGELIKVAQEHKKTNAKIATTLTYYHSSIEKHIEEFNNYYDGVVASEVIEHVDNPDLFIKCCVQALKPGGRIFFTTPNRTWYSWFVGIYLAENVFNIVPKGTHQHEKLIRPKELAGMLNKYNCKEELTCGINYRPLKIEWNLTKSQKLVYGLQAVKLD